MSLRKSPTRTPAFLAANRANARKSTGPRTPEGKRRIVLNAVKHGQCSPDFLATLRKSGQGVEEFLGIQQALFHALMPQAQDPQGAKLLTRTAALVWTVKRQYARMAADRTQRSKNFRGDWGVFPRRWQMRIRGPGWRWWATVSVWIRRGRDRSRSRAMLLGCIGPQDGRRLHAGVTVTSSMRHPLLGFRSLEEVPPGVAVRVAFKIKPQRRRKHKPSSVVIPTADWGKALPPTTGGEMNAEPQMNTDSHG